MRSAKRCLRNTVTNQGLIKLGSQKLGHEEQDFTKQTERVAEERSPSTTLGVTDRYSAASWACSAGQLSVRVYTHHAE